MPVYRDPVHDFGFFRYDPKRAAVHEAAPSSRSCPKRAQIGRDIRVVGNDAGEQLSILAGTIARLDRQAPELRPRQLQRLQHLLSAGRVGTSGGSSGSPVVDIEGRVVALNAGANTQAASSFFLPLDRVAGGARARSRRASPCRAARSQTEFVHKPFARAAPARPDARHRSARARSVSAADRAARRRAGDPGVGRVEQARARRHPRRGRRQADRRVRAARGACSTAPSAASVDVVVERGGQRARASRHGRRPARDHARRVHRVRRRRVPQALVSSRRGTSTAPCRRVRRESGLRVRQGRDPARQHRHRHRPRVASRISTISSACSSRSPTTRRCRVRFVTFDEPQTRAAAARHERPQLVPGAALPPRRRARRLAVPGARAEPADASRVEPERRHDVPAPGRAARAGRSRRRSCS